MRSLQEARSAWDDFGTYKTLSDLRDVIWASNNESFIASSLRSVCWKSFLLFQTLDRATWTATLNDSRSAYTSLREHYLRPFENPAELDSNIDPLSDSTESPWTALRNDEILREEIFQDVERCMPDNTYFRQPDTQKRLLDILFVWCKLNPDVGYRQGMHELLAPMVWVVEKDVIETAGITLDPSKLKDDDRLLVSILDGRFIEHDAFTLFSRIMQTGKSFYEPAVQENRSARNTKGPAAERDSPMILRSQHIFKDLLPAVDPELADHLEKIDIMPQIFLMRWVRLLFGREFPFDDVLQMWDFIFTNGPNLDLVDDTCVAMILRIRWELIEADTNTALTLLLRYPGVSSSSRPCSLVRDARLMKENANIAVGHRLILKHTQRQPADAPTESGRSHTPIGYGRTKSPFRSSSPAAIESLLQDAARGVINRGEKWGLNQAVRDVVGEVRKNVRGLQSGQMSPPVRESIGRNASSKQGRQDASSTIAANVLRRINALEERNKQLASMLEGAVAELWTIHKELLEDKPPNLKEESLTTLSVGVAKVQFVQAFLQDISLPLPELAVQDAPRDSSTLKNNRTQEEATEIAAGQAKASEPIASPRVVDEISSVTRSRSKPAVTATATEKPSMSPAPPQDAVRPRLAESSFSWMLGEDKNDGSSFARASPFPPNEKRSQASLDGQEKAFLFGKDSDMDKSTRKRNGNQKGSAKTNLIPVTGEDIGLGDWSVHEHRKD